MKKEYCKPNLEVIRLESEDNIALDIVSLFNGNGTNDDDFSGIQWE